MAETPIVERDHDLPMLRVHRAWERAEQLAEANGVDHHVALEIAREVIGIIGAGTRRWGHLCFECRSLMESKDGKPTCPQHGGLGMWGTTAVLLISFDPIMSAAASHD